MTARLVDKSLVIAEEANGEIRYHRLETIRQFSRERFFETEEVEAIRDRHLAYYVQFSEEVEKGLQGSLRRLWVYRSDAEQENLRTAIEWGLTRNPESSLCIVSNMVVGIATGGYSAEAFPWLRDIMLAREYTLPAIPAPVRAKALAALAFIYVSIGRDGEASACAEQAIALYRQLDDKRWLASVLLMGTRALESSGKLVEAESALKQALTQAQSDQNAYVAVWALITPTRVTARLHGDIQAAWDLTEEALQLAKNAELDGQVADVCEARGFLAAYSGRYEEARLWFDKAMDGYRNVGADFSVLLIKSNLAHLERQFGHHQQALERYRETIVGFRDIGQLGAVAHQLECFGFLAIAVEQNERAMKLFAAADALREKVSTPMTSEEQAYFEEQIRVLRQRLDAPRFEQIWTNGRALTLEQALGIALEENSE